MGTCEEYVLVGLSQQKWCSCEGSGSRIEPWTLARVGWASILPVPGWCGSPVSPAP